MLPWKKTAKAYKALFNYVFENWLEADGMLSQFQAVVNAAEALRIATTKRVNPLVGLVTEESKEVQDARKDLFKALDNLQ